VKKALLALPLLFVSSAALAEPAPSAAQAAPVYEPAEASPAPVALPAADEPATLTGSHGFLKHNGWYVAPTFGATTLDGHLSSLVGIQGGWLINRQFGIGLAGSAFGWNGAEIDSPRANTRVDGGYGGLHLQYIVASDKLVHGTIDTTVGGGGLCYDQGSNRRECNDAITFFLVEPTANVELNVTSFMRVALGAGYRFAALDDRGPANKPEVSGFVTRASIKFGQF
jgi:hypothetical protein